MSAAGRRRPPARKLVRRGSGRAGDSGVLCELVDVAVGGPEVHPCVAPLIDLGFEQDLYACGAKLLGGGGDVVDKEAGDRAGVEVPVVVGAGAEDLDLAAVRELGHPEVLTERLRPQPKYVPEEDNRRFRIVGPRTDPAQLDDLHEVSFDCCRLTVHPQADLPCAAGQPLPGLNRRGGVGPLYIIQPGPADGGRVPAPPPAGRAAGSAPTPSRVRVTAWVASSRSSRARDRWAPVTVVRVPPSARDSRTLRRMSSLRKDAVTPSVRSMAVAMSSSVRVSGTCWPYRVSSRCRAAASGSVISTATSTRPGRAASAGSSRSGRFVVRRKSRSASGAPPSMASSRSNRIGLAAGPCVRAWATRSTSSRTTAAGCRSRASSAAAPMATRARPVRSRRV